MFGWLNFSHYANNDNDNDNENFQYLDQGAQKGFEAMEEGQDLSCWEGEY